MGGATPGSRSFSWASTSGRWSAARRREDRRGNRLAPRVRVRRRRYDAWAGPIRRRSQASAAGDRAAGWPRPAGRAPDITETGDRLEAPGSGDSTVAVASELHAWRMEAHV